VLAFAEIVLPLRLRPPQKLNKIVRCFVFRSEGWNRQLVRWRTREKYRKKSVRRRKPIKTNSSPSVGVGDIRSNVRRPIFPHARLRDRFNFFLYFSRVRHFTSCSFHPSDRKTKHLTILFNFWGGLKCSGKTISAKASTSRYKHDRQLLTQQISY